MATITATTIYNPQNVDCVEKQDLCTTACQEAATRKYNIITQAAEEGRACTGPTDCAPGEDACPTTTTQPADEQNDVVTRATEQLQDVQRRLLAAKDAALQALGDASTTADDRTAFVAALSDIADATVKRNTIAELMTGIADDVESTAEDRAVLVLHVESIEQALAVAMNFVPGTTMREQSSATDERNEPNASAASANDAKRGRRGRIAGGILGTLAVVMLSVGALLQKMKRSRRANTIPNLDLRQTHAAVHNQLFAAEIMADSDYTPAFETSVALEGGHRRHDTILGVFNSMYGVSSELPARITVSSGNNALYAVPMEIAEDGQAAGGGGGGGRSSSISSATVSVASGNNTIYAVPMEMVGKANEEARRQQKQSKQLRLDAEGYVDDASVNQPQDVEYAITVVDSTVEYAPSTELPSSTVYMYTEGEAAGLADDAEYIDLVGTFPYGTAAETDADGGGRGEGQTAVSTVYAIPMDGAAIGEEEAPCTDTALAVAAGVDVPAGSAAEYAEPNALYKSADDERSLNESTL